MIISLEDMRDTASATTEILMDPKHKQAKKSLSGESSTKVFVMFFAAA